MENSSSGFRLDGAVIQIAFVIFVPVTHCFHKLSKAGHLPDVQPRRELVPCLFGIGWNDASRFHQNSWVVNRRVQKG